MRDESVPPAVDEFFAGLAVHLERGSLSRLVLAKYAGPPSDLQRVTVRPLLLRGQPHLSFVSSHATRDVTRNEPLAQGLASLRGLVGPVFRHAHLLAEGEDLELRLSQRGKASLQRQSSDRTPADPALHDRAKRRLIELDTPFLAALGVTDASGASVPALVPAMARKYKQINKFVEIIDHAIAASPLHTAPRLRVADFGSGKGYLTFAVHHHLSREPGRELDVRGIELREDLVRLCQRAADRLGLAGLHFEQGDVRDHAVRPLDVVIALHACDTATDHALHLGVRAPARR